MLSFSSGNACLPENSSLSILYESLYGKRNAYSAIQRLHVILSVPLYTCIKITWMAACDIKRPMCEQKERNIHTYIHTYKQLYSYLVGKFWWQASDFLRMLLTSVGYDASYDCHINSPYWNRSNCILKLSYWVSFV